MNKQPRIVRAIVWGGLVVAGASVVGCAGSASDEPSTGAESASQELTIEYADATRGVRGTFHFEGETFTGVATPANEGELIDGEGRTIARWQMDFVKAEVTGTIDGKPFAVNATGLDAAGATLLGTHSGKALTALGGAVEDPATKAKVPEDARIELAVLGVVAAEAAGDGSGEVASSDGTGTVSSAVTSCTTTRIERDWVVPHTPCYTWHVCEYRRTCKYPTQTTSTSTYYWGCC